MTARCYSQRLLQPFRGLAQIVEIDGADAVSRDGLHWELYIQGGVDREQDDRGEWIEIPLSDVKYGSWSARVGLSRYPTRHVTDYERIDRLGSCLLDAVREAAQRLPLPLEDRYERWLLDRDGRPLALIDSCRDVQKVRETAIPKWRPGQIAEQEFTTPDQADACMRLAALINNEAGSVAWYRRDADAIHELQLRDTGLVTCARHEVDFLPALLLRDQWPDGEVSDLVERFLVWQSPWLLTLPGLDAHTRTRLESQAFRMAMRVAELHRVYPCVLDRDGLRRALVEAALRQAGGGDEEPGEDSTLTFFVSGN